MKTPRLFTACRHCGWTARYVFDTHDDLHEKIVDHSVSHMGHNLFLDGYGRPKTVTHDPDRPIVSVSN